MNMVKFKLLLLFFLQMQLFAVAQETETLTEIHKFGENPGNLKMFVFNEEKQDTISKPLVIVLHGCSQNANKVSELTGWNKLAKLNNFTVLYPQQKMINNVSLCFNWFLKNDIEKGKGESESIYEMILYMKSHYQINEKKVFITGLSAGAAMSVVMLATHPKTFKAGAIFAGCAYKVATNPFSAVKVMLGKKQVPKEELVKWITDQNTEIKNYPLLIVYQGENDNIVNHQNANLLIEQWTAINNSDTIADKTEPSFETISDITRIEYQNFNTTKEVIYYKVQNLGHQLLINPGEETNQGGKTGIYGVDKNFHSTFQTIKDFGIIKE